MRNRDQVDLKINANRRVEITSAVKVVYVKGVRLDPNFWVVGPRENRTAHQDNSEPESGFFSKTATTLFFLHSHWDMLEIALLCYHRIGASGSPNGIRRKHST